MADRVTLRRRQSIDGLDDEDRPPQPASRDNDPEPIND
jgi:hypothetical protein